MKISWVLADDVFVDPAVDLAHLKNIGSFWGSWSTWRSCSTDNVVCNDSTRAHDLLQRDFHHRCNFYIPNSAYQFLGRPEGVRLYEGEFLHDVERQDEIVAMHLAASQSDIVLLLGFNWQQKPKPTDKLLQHRQHHYIHLVKQVIVSNAQKQWVLIDHAPNLTIELTKIPNLTQDTMQNALLLAG